ncbi:AAA family ATPase [Salinisphaera sp. Q1T1-3]|nr:AAA family ATPase [Salinisphaera sp. Q1T1-3]
MYLRYFGFESHPFAVTPDPAFLYLSASHREALAHLLYGAGEDGGFVSLIGEVGTGKTTLIRAVADSDPADLDIALCWNPQLEVREFVATICDELGVEPKRDVDTSLKSLVDRLNAHLLATHANNRRTVLIVDEAQNLSRDVLEQLRLLTNLETHKHKLLRIILVGQPELGTLLARHDLRQLAQRITARFVLRPLGQAETRAYVQHRLECANGPQHLFSRGATTALRLVTGGVPRLINMVCERALMGAYAYGRSHVGTWTVLRAAAESLPRYAMPRPWRWWRLALPTGAMAAAAVVVALAWLPDIPLTNAAEGTPSGEQSEQTGAAEKTPEASAPERKTDSDKPIVESSRDLLAGLLGGHERTATAGDFDTPKIQTAAGDSGGADDGDKNATDAQAPTEVDRDGNTARNATDITRSRNGSQTALSATLPGGNADMNQMLRLWGVFGSQVHAGCQVLRVGDLRCLADKDTLDVVRRYNRPALLEFETDGEKRSLLLTALDDRKATLVGANGTRDVSLATLEQQWDGRFRVIWRADAGVRLIQPGSVGQAVVWLRQRLDAIDGENSDNRAGKPSPIYDAALGDRLKAFQRTRGLDPDGIAGPRTQMMLNGAMRSPGTPQLGVPRAANDR